MTPSTVLEEQALTAKRAPEAPTGAGVGGQCAADVQGSGQVYPGYGPEVNSRRNVYRAQPMDLRCLILPECA